MCLAIFLPVVVTRPCEDLRATKRQTAKAKIRIQLAWSESNQTQEKNSKCLVHAEASVGQWIMDGIGHHRNRSYLVSIILKRKKYRMLLVCFEI